MSKRSGFGRGGSIDADHGFSVGCGLSSSDTKILLDVAAPHVFEVVHQVP